jgi:nicotinate phosphoribosyltransferase
LHARIKDAVRAEQLLLPVFEDGRRVVPPCDIKATRDYALQQIRSLPEECTRLRNPEFYRVILSETIGQWKESMLENPDLA